MTTVVGEWARWEGTCGVPPNERPGTWHSLSVEVNGGKRKIGAKVFVPVKPLADDEITTDDAAIAAIRVIVGGRLLTAAGL